jgi:hypothetical protein
LKSAHHRVLKLIVQGSVDNAKNCQACFSRFELRLPDVKRRKLSLGIYGASTTAQSHAQISSVGDDLFLSKASFHSESFVKIRAGFGISSSCLPPLKPAAYMRRPQLHPPEKALRKKRWIAICPRSPSQLEELYRTHKYAVTEVVTLVHGARW